MTRPAAIQADYCNFKRVRGRRVLVLEVEVPMEREREVFDVLGFPDPATGCPVAIARLAIPPRQTAEGHEPPRGKGAQGADDDRPAIGSAGSSDSTPSGNKPRKRWDELSRAQQAGIRCNEPGFGDFLRVKGRQISGNGAAGPDDTAQAVRVECTVASRAELDSNPDAAARWDELDLEYRQWAGFETEDRS